jgi:hypothetical protein
MRAALESHQNRSMTEIRTPPECRCVPPKSGKFGGEPRTARNGMLT